MELSQKLLAAVLAAGILFVSVKILRASVRLVLRLLCNTLLGFGALWVLRLIAPITGVNLGFNLGNALFIGFLGLPGVLLLLLIHWLL